MATHIFEVTVVTSDATAGEIREALHDYCHVIELPNGDTLEPDSFSVAHVSTMED